MDNSSSEPEIENTSNPCKDFALIELSDHRIFLGRGPFNHSDTPSKNGVSFYLNDFNLSSARPWLIPTTYDEITLDTLNQSTEQKPLPKLEWDEPQFADFKECFNHITELRLQGILEKAVPAVTSSASIKNPADYCLNLIKASFPHLSSLSAYAFSEEGSGFVGLSPEQIFKLESTRLQTMALAGTACSENGLSFEKDDKEKHEHQLVVESLRRRLNDLGIIQESKRETLDIGGMIHFLSKFTVTLDEVPTIDSIIRTLHPTPALGTVPRTDCTINALNRVRNKLNVPPMFGSPFGIKVGDFFEAFVLIRGLFFNENTLHLPTGCGIVEGSLLDKEWDELAFKRRWVKSSFGLNQ